MLFRLAEFNRDVTTAYSEYNFTKVRLFASVHATRRCSWMGSVSHAPVRVAAMFRRTVDSSHAPWASHTHCCVMRNCAVQLLRPAQFPSTIALPRTTAQLNCMA
jgi:hypothetical protein